jgi:DNA polymerase III subunit alpha
MRPFVNLHTHTTGSIGDSIISPKGLITAIKEVGQTAVAVTDHGSCSALWEVYKSTQKTEIKLIAGCEVYFVDNSDNNEDTTLRHLVLLAKNATGYKNLLTLNKRGFDKFTIAFKRAIPRIDWQMLEELHEGLICTSACGNGVIAQYIMTDQLGQAKAAALRLQTIFGEDFALELQPHNLQRRPSPYSGAINQQKINMALKKIGTELDIRCIVATDAHYLKKDDHDDHDAYICIASGQPKTSGSRLIYDKHEFYIKNSDEIFEHFSRHMPLWGEEFVESLFTNTIYFSGKCESPDWIDPSVSTGEKSQLPDFPYKDEPDLADFEAWKSTGKLVGSNIGEDAQFYRYRSEIGLEQKIRDEQIPESDREECYTSMLEEFDVLEYRNFSSYMLITAEFLEWCRNNQIPVGPGRGSVGGSLSAYCNHIHMAYPKRYGLIFARFLNKYKDAFPDIDNDIAPSGRDNLYNYLCSKYGNENVCHVSNINTITPKVYARDIARVFEFGGLGRSAAAEIGNNIADSLPSEMHSIKQALDEAPLFAEYAKQYPELVKYAGLCGMPRAWSTHAGGIIISKRPLTGLVPLRRDPAGALVLEYDKVQAEENGLIKIDILGLETLDIIGQTYQLIKENNKDLGNFDYESSNPAAYKLIGEGDTFGVFQLGSTAVHVCKKVKPNNIADIALISALVRPAAKDIIPNLLKVRNGEEKISLIHPALERSFGGTYGFGLFEESLMYLSLDVAGWNLHSADKLRKLTKEKGKHPELVAQWRTEFIEDSIKNNISEEIATKIWDETINGFQGYGFNKSHATLYSMISYHNAWLKANFPIEFLVANLISEVNSNAKASKDNILKIKTEIRNHKVKIVPPDVNTSGLSWKIVDDKTLMTGLDSLKYMGKDAIPELIAKRPFTSFQDLIYRTDASKVRSPSIQAMAASGSLDSFGMDRKLMFHYASDYRAKLRSHMDKIWKAWEKRLIKAGWKLISDGTGDLDPYWINPQGEAGGITKLSEVVESERISLGGPSDQDIQDHLSAFKYPFPEIIPWSIQELYALEEFYMGEGISGDMFDRYPKFFDREKTVPFAILPKMFPWESQFEGDERANRKANTHYLGNIKMRPLEGVITSMFVFTVKKEDSKIFGQEMARMMLQDPFGDELALLCFPEAWEGMKVRIEKELSGGKQKIELGLAIQFLAQFQWENEHSTSLILSDILSFKAPPSLPEDRASKKVKMPRTKRLSKEELLELSKNELLDKLEDEMLEEGISTVDDIADDDYNTFGME